MGRAEEAEGERVEEEAVGVGADGERVEALDVEVVVVVVVVEKEGAILSSSSSSASSVDAATASCDICTQRARGRRGC